MRLSNDEITITLSPGVSVILRASLRAAFHLNQTYGGFQALSQAIAEGNLTVITDLMTMACINQTTWTKYALADDRNIIPELLAARDQLLAFVLVLSGANEKSDTPQIGQPITFDEYHAKLFRIATGWLGWTPDVAWNATASEIINAHQGRIEMIGAIFGGKDDQTETIDTTSTQARAELNALGDLSVTTMSQVR